METLVRCNMQFVKATEKLLWHIQGNVVSTVHSFFKEFSMGIPFVRTRCSELFNMPVKQSVTS